MSVKYRIRLASERVIGPFSNEEIGELFIKGHIVGTELCQQFPIGDWKPLPSCEPLQEIIQSIREKNLQNIEPHYSSDLELVGQTNAKENPKVKKSNPIKAALDKKEGMKVGAAVPMDGTKSGLKTFTEFKFGKDVRIDVNYEELEKKYKAANPNVPYDNGLAKTVVIRKLPTKATEADLEKTVVIKKPNLVKPKSEVKSVPVPEVKKEAPKEVIRVLTDAELINEKTQFMNLSNALPVINAQLSVSEVELEKQAKIEEIQEKRRLREIQEIILKEQAIADGEEPDELEVVEEFDRDAKDFDQRIIIKKKKKGMSVVAIAAFIGVFYFFLQPEDKPVATGPVYLEVKFPITAAVENLSAASVSLAEARNLYSQNTYIKRAIATGYYVNSLQHKFSGNEAMGETILAYSELLDNTKERHQSANTIYKFIQLSESKMLSDQSTVTGTALFYNKIQKYQTGIYTVKNYLRAGNKPTPKMLTYYLDLLTNAGELVEARKVFDSLSKIPKKPLESYYYLAAFEIFDDKIGEAKIIIDEGLKYYPNSVLLLLQQADVLLKEQAFKEFEATLLKVKAINAERSPSYLASFYQYMGYLAAYKSKQKEASQFFKLSLKFKESNELRAMLSSLEVSGDKLSQALILESKIIGLLKKAKSEYKNRNIESAFQFVIEAVDANPDYVPSVVFQAYLNTERGFFESAIYSLQRIISINQQNPELKKMLVEVYLKAYKFEDAERTLAEIAQTKFAFSPEYASLMAQFAEAKKNPILAIRWYDKALARDPLSDYDLYQMAKILVRSKRFPEARSRLSKALLLDPKNVNYLALNAEILYEQDGTDTAIGYLRDVISEVGEDPILISSIAAAYFKSGQIKEFQSYYKKVQAMPKKDEGFYDFLRSGAKLDGRKDEYIQHSKDLLKLNPGNLKVRMELGEVFFEEQRYDDAIEQFNEIKEKLTSYPRVHYQLARVYLSKGDVAKAKLMAEKELELNPQLDSAHFISGEVYRLNRQYREAIQKYEKAIGLNPKSVEALMAMGLIRLNQNYANESIELFSRALKEDPTNANIHKQMGDAYRAAGQRALAKEKYEDYLKLNPGAQDKELIDSLIRNLR